MEQWMNSQEKTPEGLKPYPLTNHGNDFYTFETDYNIIYGVRFKDINLPRGLENYNFEVSEFEFLNYSDKQPVRDKRVVITIGQILKSYLDNPLKVAVYICDEEGEKQRGAYRQALFQIWHRSMGDGYKLEKLRPKLITRLGSLYFYAGIIHRSDCPNQNLLITSIREAAPDAIREKYFSNEDL